MLHTVTDQEAKQLIDKLILGPLYQEDVDEIARFDKMTSEGWKLDLVHFEYFKSS